MQYASEVLLQLNEASLLRSDDVPSLAFCLKGTRSPSGQKRRFLPKQKSSYISDFELRIPHLKKACTPNGVQAFFNTLLFLHCQTLPEFLQRVLL